MRAVLLAAVLCAMVGCSAAERKQMQAEIDQCRSAVPLRVGSYTARTECTDAVFRRHRQQMRSEDQLFMAYRMKVAKQIDAGEITPEDGRLLVAQARYQLDQAARQTQAAEASAEAARTAAWMPLIQAAQPQQAAQPITTTCSRMGGFTNCISR